MGRGERVRQSRGGCATSLLRGHYALRILRSLYHVLHRALGCALVAHFSAVGCRGLAEIGGCARAGCVLHEVLAEQLLLRRHEEAWVLLRWSLVLDMDDVVADGGASSAWCRLAEVLVEVLWVHLAPLVGSEGHAKCILPGRLAAMGGWRVPRRLRVVLGVQYTLLELLALLALDPVWVEGPRVIHRLELAAQLVLLILQAEAGARPMRVATSNCRGVHLHEGRSQWVRTLRLPWRRH